MIMQVLF